MLKVLIAAVTTGSLLVNPAYAKQEAKTGEFEAPVKVSEQGSLALLAVTCSDESWAAFAKKAKTMGFAAKTSGPEQTYTFKWNENRVAVDGAEVEVSALDGGLLEMKIDGLAVKGKDSCELATAYWQQEQKKSATFSLLIPDARAIEEPAKHPTAERSGLNLAVGVAAGVVAATSSGVVLPIVLGFMAGHLLGSALYEKKQVDAMALHEAMLNSQTLSVSECSHQRSIFNSRVDGKTYDIIVNKEPVHEINYFENNKKLDFPYAYAAERSRHAFFRLAGKCNSEDAKVRLNDRIHAMVSGADLRLAEFRGARRNKKGETGKIAI